MTEAAAAHFLILWEAARPGARNLFELGRTVQRFPDIIDPEASKQVYALIKGALFPALIDPRTNQKFDYPQLNKTHDENIAAALVPVELPKELTPSKRVLHRLDELERRQVLQMGLLDEINGLRLRMAQLEAAALRK